jgi:Thioredoxin like C-terminal domain
VRSAAHLYGCLGTSYNSISRDFRPWDRLAGVRHTERRGRRHCAPLPCPRPASGDWPGSGRWFRFKIAIDGAPPTENHEAGTDATGPGLVTDQRHYQLARQTGSIADHRLEIELLDPGIQAYSFTSADVCVANFAVDGSADAAFV